MSINSMYSAMDLAVIEKSERSLTSSRRRRRDTLQEKVLKGMVQHGAALHTLVAAELGPSRKSPSRLAFEAAYLFLILQHGSEEQKARCRPLIQRIRRMKLARDISAELTDQEFLEHIIEVCAGNRKTRAESNEVRSLA